ncbi:replication protein A 70 kDa DNA-binding subunit E-like [Cryptomeria japonica]|uniref:replication protein A 70 kDa DNA-binding subunit E-like n=1 Tax=Cryptomeria japonica TaxID=3369 RepID=UPI0027D9DE63|nr:replication protein A 70 kDa DNA-binding subunit E-like [Cryptomeria japonica]
MRVKSHDNCRSAVSIQRSMAAMGFGESCANSFGSRCDYFTRLPCELDNVTGLKLQGLLLCFCCLTVCGCRYFHFASNLLLCASRILDLFMFFNCLWAWLLPLWKSFSRLLCEFHDVNALNLQGLLICLRYLTVCGRDYFQFARQFRIALDIVVDLGCVVALSEWFQFARKDGSQTQKRVVKINDLSGSTIDINLWGPMAEQKGLELKNMLANDSVVILALCNARVGYFNGKLINITVATTLHINPTFLEAELLTLRGKDPLLVIPFVAKTIHIDGKYTRMTISSIREQMSIKPEKIQITLLAVMRFVNVNDQNFYYAACPLIVNGRPCKKKCTQRVDDSWFWSRCQITIQDCNYSYLLPLKLQDATGTLWAIAFDEGSIHLLHKTTKQLYALQNDATTTETTSSMIKRLLSRYYSFTLLVSTETYNLE